MSLAIFYVTIFLSVAHASELRCPAPSQILPCECDIFYKGGFTLYCVNASLDRILEPLAAFGKRRGGNSFWIMHVPIPNLPPKLIQGNDVYKIEINECNTSTVDENAFVDVAAKLELLSLSGNPLEEVPSHALQKLSNLPSLFLEDNKIQVLRAGAFKGLDSLNFLSLDGNRIKFIDDFAFEGLGRKLESLYLSHNELTSVPGKQLSKLWSLRNLVMENNKIASLVPDDFDAMGGIWLYHLRLANNTIRHLPARVFKSLERLSILRLSGNVIESIHPLAFEGNEGILESLYLHHNRLEEVPTTSLKNLSALHYIDLSYNSICKLRKGDFLPYGKKLEYLLLHKNSLKYVDLEAFIHLDRLAELSLQSNELTSAPFQTYSPLLDTLRRFDIHDNPLYCDCSLSWLSNWIHGDRSWVVRMANETICATPERHAKRPLDEIPLDQLVCENSTSKSTPEPCCNCVTSAHQRLYSDWYLTLSQLGVTYAVTTFGRNRLLM